jgi:hypothetical protein
MYENVAIVGDCNSLKQRFDVVVALNFKFKIQPIVPLDFTFVTRVVGLAPVFKLGAFSGLV